MSVLDEFRRLPDPKLRLSSEERPARPIKTFSVLVAQGKRSTVKSAGLRIDASGALVSEHPVWVLAAGYWLSVEEAQADDPLMNAVKEGL